MTFEMECAVAALVLALVHVGWAAAVQQGEMGMEWGMGARDEPLARLSPLAGRLKRAQINYYETMPIFVFAIVLGAILGRTNAFSWWGSLLFIAGRTLYLPIYVAGTPRVRTYIWGMATLGVLSSLIALVVPR